MGPALSLQRSLIVDALGAIVVALVVATIVGLIVLWPHRRLATHGQLGPVRTYSAVTERTKNLPCSCLLRTAARCRGEATRRAAEGPDDGADDRLGGRSVVALTRRSHPGLQRTWGRKGASAYIEPYSLRMTLLRPRVDELLPVPAVAPRPPFVHVPAYALPPLPPGAPQPTPSPPEDVY